MDMTETTIGEALGIETSPADNTDTNTDTAANTAPSGQTVGGENQNQSGSDNVNSDSSTAAP